MKVYCVGFTEKDGVSKKTGKEYSYTILHCLKKTVNSCGYAVEDFFIDMYSSIGEALSDSVEGSFIGCIFDVDRNSKGFIDSLEYISREPDLAQIDW